jgi:hypothetical protein
MDKIIIVQDHNKDLEITQGVCDISDIELRQDNTKLWIDLEKAEDIACKIITFAHNQKEKFKKLRGE